MIGEDMAAAESNKLESVMDSMEATAMEVEQLNTLKSMDGKLDKLQATADQSAAYQHTTAVKTSHMEVRSNFKGHDAEAVMNRALKQDLGLCSAKKLQVQHYYDVKMTMVEPVLKNEKQLECALLTRNVKQETLKKAVELMKMEHKLKMCEVNRIGSEKAGDLCSQLMHGGWHERFGEESNVKAVMQGCKQNAQMARCMVTVAMKELKKEYEAMKPYSNEDKKMVKEASEYGSNIEKRIFFFL